MNKLIIKLLLSVMICLSIISCLPGSQTATLAPSAPSDEVLASMLRAIEERKSDKFLATVDANCIPTPDNIWMDLTAFYNKAELIEFYVTVDRRIDDEKNKVTYIFTWERKYDNKTTGNTVNSSGRSEWTFIKRPNEPFMLIQMTGDSLFNI